MRVQIGLGQIDPSAKPDSMPASADVKSWVNLYDLKLDGLTVKNILTCEHNQSILDGAGEEMPDIPEQYTWGLWSSEFSDENGNFENPPVLDIGFGFNHKTPGLNLLFYPHSDDWASKVNVTWYDSSNNIIHSGTYQFDSTNGEIIERIVSFRRIKIEFLSTNIRNRYIKLIGINYGTGRSFEEEIDTASILEEIDPTSNEITINTLNFRIKTHNPEFSIVSGYGDEMLMRNQQMIVIANEKEFGTFFLQFPWKDVHSDGTVIDFQAVDAIGIMDKYQFWGNVYSDTPIETVISQLFTICFPTQLIRYVIDPAFAGKLISGYIPICTCREALQYICFAIGAIADDSRRDYVWIYPPDTILNHKLEPHHVYRSPEISPTTYYSGVDVVAYEYIPSEETVEAHNSILAAGRHIIKFSEPLYNLTISGGTIIESTANHAVINVSSDGEVILSGNIYNVNMPVFQSRQEVVAGEVENIKIYDNCTLMSPKDAQAAAERLYNYLSQRTQFSGDVRLEENEPGYLIQVPTIRYPISGTIEQLDINLRGGRARMKVIGDVYFPDI